MVPGRCTVSNLRQGKAGALQMYEQVRGPTVVP